MDASLSCSRAAKILNQRGLHARAAAKFVKLANEFEAEIQVRRGEMTASGRSIMGLMMLAAAPGCDIEVTAVGRDAETALAAIMALVGRKFDED